jgi:putative ABC transport system substrate-binding protein
MRRRILLTHAAAASFGLSMTRGVAHAQPAGKVYRVGALFNAAAMVNGKPALNFDVLKKGMAALGYVEGTHVIYEPRFAEGQLERLPGFAAELVDKGVDVIVAIGGPPTAAARKATTTIPIVVALVADPVAIGVAATLARPGGNITGVTNDDPELAGRQMAILKELHPKMTRVAILSDAQIPGADASGLAPIERTNVAAARAAGLTPQVLKVRGPKPDLEGAFDAMARDGAESMVVLEVPAVFNISRAVAAMAATRRMPTMLWGGQGDAGALVSYGTDFVSTYPSVAIFVDKVLKGAKPADTPIEVVSRRELAVNLKVARELGITLPADLLKRADRVID